MACEEVGHDGNGKDGLKGYLRRVAVENPQVMGSLLGKVLPMQHTGADGGPIRFAGPVFLTSDEDA